MERNSGSHSEKSEDGQALLHTPRPVTSLKSLQTTDSGEAVEKREPFYTVGGKVNGHSHCGKLYGGVGKEKINQDGSDQALSPHGLLHWPHIL